VSLFTPFDGMLKDNVFEEKKSDEIKKARTFLKRLHF
jgi:hypothetical protein